MKVNICGIPHEVIECEDKFDVDLHFGQIDYKTCEIGYSEESENEQFVQALANAIYQGFCIKNI